MWTGCSAMGAANKKEALWQKKKKNGTQSNILFSCKTFQQSWHFFGSPRNETQMHMFMFVFSVI